MATVIHRKARVFNPQELSRLNERLDHVRNVYEQNKKEAKARFGAQLAAQCCVNPPRFFFEEQQVDFEEIELDRELDREIYKMGETEAEYSHAKEDKASGLITLPPSGRYKAGLNTMFDMSRLRK